MSKPGIAALSCSLALLAGCTSYEESSSKGQEPVLTYAGGGYGGRVHLRLVRGEVIGGEVETLHRDCTDAPLVFPIRVLDQLAPDRYSVVTCGGDRLQHVAFELQVAEVDAAALHYRFSPRGDHAAVVYSGTAVCRCRDCR